MSAVAVAAPKPGVTAAAAEQDDDYDAPPAIVEAESADTGVVTAIEATEAVAAAT